MSFKHFRDIEPSDEIKEIVGWECIKCGEQPIFELKDGICEICLVNT